MNTSMLSPSSDFATYISGGAPHANAHLKEIFASHTNAKPAGASGPSRTPTPSDFEAMLHTPATVTLSSSGSTGPSSNPLGQLLGDEMAAGTDAGQSLLMAELSPVVTATLQIKGMISGLNHPASLLKTTELQSSENILPAQAQSALDETPSGLTGVKIASAGLDQTLASPSGLSGTTVGMAPALPEVVEKPAVRVTTRSATEGNRPARHGAIVNLSNVVVLPAEIPGATLLTALGGMPSLLGATPAALVPPEETPADPLIQGNCPDKKHSKFGSVQNQTEFSDSSAALEVEAGSWLAQIIAAPVSGIHVIAAKAGDNIILAGDPADRVGAKTGKGTDATVPAPAPSVCTQTLGHQGLNESSAPIAALVPTIESMAEIGAVPSNVTEPIEMPPITPGNRREVIEAVAALLAPLWLSLTAIMPESVPVAADTSGLQATALDGGQKAPSTLVTIKFGAQQPVQLELPLPASFQSAIRSLTLQPQTDQRAGERTLVGDGRPLSTAVHSNPVLPVRQEGAPVDQEFLQLPALNSLMTGGLPLDFRQRLKTIIEAAWQKAEPLTIDLSSKLVPSASDAVLPQVEPSPEHASGPLDSLVAQGMPLPVMQNSAAFKFTASLAEPPAAVAVTGEAHPPASVVEVMIEMPGIGSLAAQIIAPTPLVNSLDRKSLRSADRAEKNAGVFRLNGNEGDANNNAVEKTFLNTDRDGFRSKGKEAGTGVAISGDNMSAQFTSRRLAVDQLEFPPRINARDFLPALVESQNTSAASDDPVTTTPAPVLAHRAVETIMNVIDAQRTGAANASSVNLHFKFGGDDLAVRVQLRGGEVLTQFLTDSAELRSALSNEWQIMAGQGGAAGLRLLDPVILASSTGTNSGFGSSSQGQNQTQQQAQHQQNQAAVSPFELRELRHGVVRSTPTTTAAPRVSLTQPTSHHLTAMA